MAGKKSKKGKGYFAAYQGGSVYSKNKARKIARHVKQHPDDKQSAQAALNPKQKSKRFGYKGTDKAFKSRLIAQLEKRVKHVVKMAVAANAKRVSVNIKVTEQKPSRKAK